MTAHPVNLQPAALDLLVAVNQYDNLFAAIAKLKNLSAPALPVILPLSW
jgi:hypothetical protein